MTNPIGPIRRRIRRLGDKLRYLRDFREFRDQQRRAGPGFSPLRWKERYPILGEWTSETKFDLHYTYHPAWAVRVLAQTRPREHVDISSSLAFAAMASAFVPLRFYDYRPARLKLSGLTCGRADVMALPFPDGSLPSLSCMHVVEHIGLGRYGDPVDVDGDRKAMRELARVVAPGGDLLFVVPVGRERIEFNAHRVYACETVLERFADLDLVRLDLIPDDAREAGMIENARPAQGTAQELGCGCFWFRKKALPPMR